MNDLGRRWLLMSAGLTLAAAWGRVARADARADYFKAIELDKGDWLRRLLDAGADPNTADERGRTGLFLALRDSCFDAAEVLIAHPKTRIDEANASGETPAMMAALRGQLEWVRRLIDRGAAVNRSGWTPLHYAASGPAPEVVELLLGRGAIIDSRSANGTTPLMMAAGYGAIDAATLLLGRGGDARLRNSAGLNAADFARRAGRDALAVRLEQVVR